MEGTKDGIGVVADSDPVKDMGNAAAVLAALEPYDVLGPFAWVALVYVEDEWAEGMGRVADEICADVAAEDCVKISGGVDVVVEARTVLTVSAKEVGLKPEDSSEHPK